MNRDVIFAFIGGGVIATAGTVTVMKRLGYIKPTEEQKEVLYLLERETQEKIGKEADPTLADTVSFKQEDTLNTHKTQYNSLKEKPDLEDMAKKYEQEDSGEDENDDPNPELADAVQTEEDDYTEYGHIIMQLPASRKDQLIFLVPQEHAGEIYYLEELFYYEVDDVLADVTDAAVDDPLGVIGDSFEYFGQYGADEDLLFVRNITLGMEFQVERIHKRYADVLYGIDTEKIDKNREKRKTKMKGEKDDD